jgi:hypothetical protein
MSDGMEWSLAEMESLDYRQACRDRGQGCMRVNKDRQLGCGPGFSLDESDTTDIPWATRQASTYAEE